MKQEFKHLDLQSLQAALEKECEEAHAVPGILGYWPELRHGSQLSTDIVLRSLTPRGPYSYAVTVSQIEYPEETMVVVFRNNETNPPKSVTRHYQPPKYFARKTAAEMAQARADVSGRVLRNNRNLSPKDLQEKLDAEFTKISPWTSEVYATNVTRQNREWVHFDILHFLMDGTLPKPYTGEE